MGWRGHAYFENAKKNIFSDFFQARPQASNVPNSRARGQRRLPPGGFARFKRAEADKEPAWRDLALPPRSTVKSAGRKPVPGSSPWESGAQMVLGLFFSEMA